MRVSANYIIAIAGALYLVALALLLIGTFGLFSQERDPLAGVFLMLLGLSWVAWTEGLPERFRPFTAVSTSPINIVIPTLLCRTVRSRVTD